MAFLKTRGIVIKETGLGEADKIVSLFSDKCGRISASVKGGKRSGSRLAAASQLLCYGEFILYSGKSMYSVNSCEVIEPFYEIRSDMEKLTYAAHFTDIVNVIVQENQPSAKLLRLFLNSLYMLAKTEKPPELISRIFEMRTLMIAGYAPSVANCMLCGFEARESFYFSFTRCGLICDRSGCREGDESAMEVSFGVVRALQHIIYSKMDTLFSFMLSPEALQELGRICRKYLSERLERDFNKLDFLKNI